MRLAVALSTLALAATAFAQPRSTVHFKRMAEPREHAFSFIAPSDWRVSGGITRVNPLTSGGSLNAISAKLDMTLASPDGRITMHWLPEMLYMDSRRMLAGGAFPPGSNYNGATVWPLVDAFGYMQQAMFARLHPSASGVQVKGRYPLPKAAESYQQVVRQMGIPFQFRFDVALMVVTYSEGGRAWEEALYTGIQDYGNAGAGLWNNKDSFTVRAPAGELDKTGPVVATILNSLELNPAWVEGEIRGQMDRNQIAARTQQEIARIDREIVEHRRRTNAEINNQMYHSLMGTDEYVNPHTKKVETGTNAWQYRWVNSNGEAIYTDDPNYNPRQHGSRRLRAQPGAQTLPRTLVGCYAGLHRELA